MEIKKTRILAIDDNRDNLTVLKALIDEGFPDAVYLSADSGSKGYELCQYENPDVILLDIVMPGMDGYEVCSKIKQNIKTSHIPVIMVTANRTDSKIKLKALDSGADAFLQKPIDESELKAQIRAMLRIKISEDQKKEEKERLEDLVLDRTEALENELADRKKAENKLIQSLDKLNRNRQAIMNLMSDLRNEMAEKKLVEDNLQAERNLLRTLIDNLPDNIYILDTEGRKVVANTAEVKSIGASSENEVLGKSDIELYSAEIGARGHADNLSVINSGTPIIDLEELFYDKNGEPIWFLSSKFPLYDSNGKIKGLLGTGHNITRRKIIENSIRQKNDELYFLNKLATDLAGLDYEENIFAFINSRLKEFTGSEFLVYSEFETETNRFITRHIEAEQKVLNRLIKAAGEKILNNPAPFNISEESFSEMASEIVIEKKSLNDISFGAIPVIVDKVFSSFTRIDRYLGLSYVVAGNVFGTSLVGLKKDKSTPSLELLKSFAYIIAVSLQRRKTEATLKISEENYRTLIQNQGEGVAIVDLEGKFVFVNPAAERMFGVESGKLLNRNLVEFIVPDQVAVFSKESKKRLKNDSSTYEIQILISGGKKHTILITATPQFTDEGILKGTFTVFRDITERKLMEQKIVESEAYYRTLIDTSPDGIIISDLEGTVSYGSIKAYEIFGVPPSENVIGTSILRWLASENHAAIMDRVTDILKGNIVPETREYKLCRFNGEIFWGELSSSPILNPVGSPTALIIVCRDISDRKKVELELIKSKEKAEESDKLKTAFIHNISHEIRTPMNAIIGFASLLAVPDTDKESQSSYIEVITQSCYNLLGIVTDIIEISNIEAGILKLNTKNVDLTPVIKNMQELFSTKLHDKGVEFKVNPDILQKELILNTDEAKLQQILKNLLRNALKFTSKGSVSFGYTLKKGKIEFFVSDSGIGISAEHHLRIFDRFYQVENEIDRQYEGTGLGLSISKGYVELLGGEIWLKSELGKGSTFFFTLPFEGGEELITTEPTAVIKAKPLASSVKKTILIAEDEENNFKFLKAVLSPLNLNIIYAENGQQAVDACKNDESIDLVVMDIKMPVMDGYEATAIIKKMRPTLPVIAQTAYAFEADRENALNAGCDDYIAKPVKRQVLIDIIMKYLNS